MKYAKKLGSAYHKRLLHESNDAKTAHTLALVRNQILQADSKNQGSIEVKDVAPPENKMLFTPGNSSAAALIKHLSDAGGRGIICEPEAETIINVFNQDWGGYSDLLLKGFHQEEINYSRKKYLVINRPQISIAITSTPHQVYGLIKSAADGLMSRFIYYTYKTPPGWRSMKPDDEPISLSDQFEVLSEEAHTIIKHFEISKWRYELTGDQWEIFDRIFSAWLNETSICVSEDATQIIKRLGLIVYRISMVLSLLRQEQKEVINNRIVCNDVDFQTAMALGEVYKEHALYVYSVLSKNEKNKTVADKNLKLFYEMLPNRFSRKDALTVGEKLSIVPRTVDKYLAKLVDSGNLTQPKYGEYSKPNADEMKQNQAA